MTLAITLTAAESVDLANALAETAAALVPGAASTYDEDAGTWVTTLGSDPLQINLAALAIITAQDLAHLLRHNRAGQAAGFTWAPAGEKTGPWHRQGGTLESNATAMSAIIGIAWQVIACREFVPHPDALEGDVIARREHKERLTITLRKIMRML